MKGQGDKGRSKWSASPWGKGPNCDTKAAKASWKKLNEKQPNEEREEVKIYDTGWKGD